MNKESLEHIIKQKFEGASSDIPANAWSGIESQIGGAASSVGAGSLSIAAKVLIGAAVAAGVITMGAMLFSTQENNSLQPTEQYVDQTAISDSSKEEEKDVEVANENSSSAKSQVETPMNNVIKPAPIGSITSSSAEDSKTDEVNEINSESASSPSNSTTGSRSQTNLTQESASQKVDEEIDVEAEKKIIPSKILALETSSDPLTYSFKLDKLGESAEVRWYVDEEFIINNMELVYEFYSDSDVNIIALIETEDEEPVSIIKNLRVELPIKIFVPNVFSPNGDGLNDSYTIDLNRSQNVSDHSLVVLNKNSEVVFESSEEAKEWDGRLFDGSPAPVGVYFYIIEAKSSFGQTVKETGKLSLKR